MALVSLCRVYRELHQPGIDPKPSIQDVRFSGCPNFSLRSAFEASAVSGVTASHFGEKPATCENRFVRLRMPRPSK